MAILQLFGVAQCIFTGLSFSRGSKQQYDVIILPSSLFSNHFFDFILSTKRQRLYFNLGGWKLHKTFPDVTSASKNFHRLAAGWIYRFLFEMMDREVSRRVPIDNNSLQNPTTSILPYHRLLHSQIRHTKEPLVIHLRKWYSFNIRQHDQDRHPLPAGRLRHWQLGCLCP